MGVTETDFYTGIEVHLDSSLRFNTFIVADERAEEDTQAFAV